MLGRISALPISDFPLREGEDETLTLLRLRGIRRRCPRAHSMRTRVPLARRWSWRARRIMCGLPICRAPPRRRVGAGLVILGVAGSIYPLLAAKLTEVTYLLLADERGALTSGGLKFVREHVNEYRALLWGPGWAANKRPAILCAGFCR